MSDERRLAAILAADVVGFSRLMEIDEAGTLAALKAHRTELVEPIVASQGGRIVKLMGDGVLVEFASVVDAVECAVAMQRGIAERNESTPDDKRIVFRIGINLGDVIIDGDDIYGDGVNVAARLEALAEPGGICLSGTVHEHVAGKLDHGFADDGEHTVKNIQRPVHVWRWTGSTVDPVRGTTPLALPDKPSIAVLPFTNMSGDPEQEYFADGMTEDIITELSRFRSLFVIARNSSFTFKGRAVKVQDVGRELGVAFLVEGSVRKAGDRVRVTVQLVKTGTGEHVWAERYDRDIADIFAVQDELVLTVATTIGGRLGSEDRKRAFQNRRVNINAYDNVLRAQSLYYQISRTANAEARPLLEAAIDLDPDFARAYVVLAATHNMDFMQSWSIEPEQSLEAALVYCQTALRLDDADSLVHAQLGEILQNLRRIPEAARHFERALSLNPNDVETRTLYGSFIGGKRGLEQLDIAERLDPCSFVWIPWIKGTTFFDMQRYDEAVASLEQIDARIVTARGWLAAGLAHLGRLDEARAVLQEFLEAAKGDLAVMPDSPETWQAFWRREGANRLEEDFQHLCDGLRKAGLDL